MHAKNISQALILSYICLSWCTIDRTVSHSLSIQHLSDGFRIMHKKTCSV